MFIKNNIIIIFFSVLKYKIKFIFKLELSIKYFRLLVNLIFGSIFFFVFIKYKIKFLIYNANSLFVVV